MKALFVSIALASLLAISSTAQAQAVREFMPDEVLDTPTAGYTQDAFEADANALRAKRDAKKITEIQYAKEALSLVRRFQPNNYEAHTVFEYQVLLATKFQKKKISQEEYQYLWAERLNEYLAKAKKAEDQARADEEYRQTRQNIAERESARMAEEKARSEQAYREHLAIAAAEDERQQRIRATAGFLQGMGNTFSRTYQNPTVNCTSLPLGTGVSTTCR